MVNARLRVAGVTLVFNGVRWTCRSRGGEESLQSAESHSRAWAILGEQKGHLANPVQAMVEWIAERMGGTVVQDFVPDPLPEGAIP